MPRVFIDNIPVIKYDHKAKAVYWTMLSKHIAGKFGKRNFKDHADVELILVECFSFLIDQFHNLVTKENQLSFFLYIFWLHEESIKLYIKTLRGLELDKIDEYEFATYRRILKLILEQGCDIDMVWGKKFSIEGLRCYDEQIQELLYIATWVYQFSVYIAYQKMIENCYEIGFTKEGDVQVQWQYHYGIVHDDLFPMLRDDYVKGAFDENAIHELKASLENCFSIDYDFAGGHIFEIQKQLNPTNPVTQTIQPHVLPINLSNAFGIPIASAQRFYDGITLSRRNKLSIEQAVLKPYSMQRYLFRPILIYNVQGEERAIIGIEKFAESMLVLATNAIHWGALQPEWLSNKCVQKFVTKKGHEHDKILEDRVEEILKEKRLLYCRNIKTFKQPKKDNIRIDNAVAGEIDFIIINNDTKKIYVADSKYNRSRYEAVGFRNDNSNFVNLYEPQLQRKVTWIERNLKILQEHLKIIYRLPELDIEGFKTVGVFFINTPTFYMFNGAYRAITLNQVSRFLDGKDVSPTFILKRNIGGTEKETVVGHPYFRKPED